MAAKREKRKEKRRKKKEEQRRKLEEIEAKNKENFELQAAQEKEKDKVGNGLPVLFLTFTTACVIASTVSLLISQAFPERYADSEICKTV